MGLNVIRVMRQTGIGACRTGALCGLFCGLGLLMLWTLSGTVARGQAQNTGSIYGSVTDPSGAVIPNATVQVTEPEKGISRTQKTGKTGEYTMNSLPVGVYTLTVSRRMLRVRSRWTQTSRRRLWRRWWWATRMSRSTSTPRAQRWIRDLRPSER